MSSLADKIIEQNSSSMSGEELDLVLGIPLQAISKNPVDHLAARIIVLNPNMYIDPVDNSIWRSDVRIREDASTITALANYYDRQYHLPNIYPLVYNRLRELLPRLSRDKLWISPTLLFNRKTGELEEQLPKENHI